LGICHKGGRERQDDSINFLMFISFGTLNLLNKGFILYPQFMKRNEASYDGFIPRFQQAGLWLPCKHATAAEPIFNDPVFGLLQGRKYCHVGNAVQKRPLNFVATFSDISCGQELCHVPLGGGVHVFKNGPQVTNNIKAAYAIQEGAITELYHQFNFY